jgi:hypothetical protein
MRLGDITTYDNSKLYNTKKIIDFSKCEDEYYLKGDKDKLKLIKTIERVVRSSMEYRDFVKYLKDYVNMDKCSFYTNVCSKDARRKISIEIHHEPFTLFDICHIVLNRQMNEEPHINTLAVAEEVIKNHYQNRIGLIPLSITVHQLVHSGKVIIPLQCVYGEYIQFLETYGAYISDELNNLLRLKIEISKDVADTSILEKKFVYLEVDGMLLPQKISQ